jgi:hypothetical protein
MFAMPSWFSARLKRTLSGNRTARFAYCEDDAAASSAAVGPAAADEDGDEDADEATAAPAATTSKPGKTFKPLPRPGSFQQCDGISQQIMGVLHQQDEGAQVVVSKQLTPLLAVVHDFNIGIEEYIPKQLGASIYTFRVVLNNFAKTKTLTAGIDWFGRLNASYQHKWGRSASSTISTHLSKPGGVRACVRPG